MKTFSLQPPSGAGSEDSKTKVADRENGLKDIGAPEQTEINKSRSEELSDEELERRRNALLQQLHAEEADWI